MASAPTASASRRPAHRNRAIDGWRGVAALLVVFAHAFSYRYAWLGQGAITHYAARFAGPLASLGVQLFFVISGYIITSLLIREEAERGRIGIAAFYARRSLRILPPLVAYYAVLLLLAAGGAIALPGASLASSASFTCNTGIVDCAWWVAHTWSLAVEEQFYLGWPLLFVLLARSRATVLAALLLVLMVGYGVQRPPFQSNFTSFACLAAGALYAASPACRRLLQRATHPLGWIAVMMVLAVAPLFRIAVAVNTLLPVLVVYAIFAGNALRPVRAVLDSRPLQWVGLCSYSLYLWQQLFLAAPGKYLASPPPLILLPIAVVLSVWLVEKPFIRVGHRLSARLRPPAAPAPATARA